MHNSTPSQLLSTFTGTVSGPSEMVQSHTQQAETPSSQDGVSPAALVFRALNDANAAYAERLKLTDRVARLEADLNECREYLETHVDVVDGSYGESAPNRAMILVSMIDQTLGKF